MSYIANGSPIDSTASHVCYNTFENSFRKYSHCSNIVERERAFDVLLRTLSDDSAACIQSFRR